MSETLTSKTPNTVEEKADRWRQCPIGKHLVREHSEHIPQMNYWTHQLTFARVFVGFSEKKETASNRLGREATWFEAVEDYKSILKPRLAGKKYNPKPMHDLHVYYKQLQEHKK